MFFQLRVDFQNLASDGEEQVWNCFHYLDGTEYFAFIQRFTFCGYVDENDVAQLLLCIVCDTYIGSVAFQTNPFVFVGVLDVSREFHIE